MGILSDLLGSGGYEDAQNQLQKYYEQAQKREMPFWQRGIDAGGKLSDAASQLMHPEQLQQHWLQDYQESPQAHMTEEQAQQHGLGAASSMGLMGSSPALQAIQGGTTNIGLADRKNYLHDMMNKYLHGVGLQKGMYDTGAHMAGLMGQEGAQMGQRMGQMQYGADEAPWDTLGNIGGGLLDAYTAGIF